MKIPRAFFYFLGVAQAIILTGHWALYKSLVFFIPFFSHHATGLALVLFLLAISFLGLSILDFRSENPFLRLGYILAAVWLPLWFFLLVASLLSAVVYLFFPRAIFVTMPVTYSIAIALVVYGVINARVHRIVSVQVPLPALPKYWEDKTVVMVSDLHLGHVLRKKFALNVIKKINTLKPDIVLIPGDFFDGIKTTFEELAAVFQGVKSTHGIFYVTGNHEEIAGYKICEQAIAKAGIKVLENAKVEIEGLQIVGLAYFSESKETAQSIQEILKSLNIESQKPSILLKHVPNLVDASQASGISLQLSGHTHHGQIWPGRYLTKKIYKGFDYGLKKLKGMYIYTSSGAGTWGPPIRIFTKSEIIKITLAKG